jgi:predicted N-acetyltransferase YhbS
VTAASGITLTSAVPRVGLLADHAGLVPQVAGWLYHEWWRELGDTPGAAEARLRQRLQRDRLPLALLALDGDEPVGTVSIVVDDHPLAPGSVCCLAGLFVCPDWRRQGIGAALCQCALREARRLELPPLCLFTKDGEAFYRRLGWQKLSDTVVCAGRGLELVAFMTWQGGEPSQLPGQQNLSLPLSATAAAMM